MSQSDCIFCQIARKKAPATIRYETDDILAFDSIDPKAATHLLVIPKRHLEHLGHASDQDQPLLGQLLLATRDIAEQLKLGSFKLVANNGRASGQSVDHFHLHLLSGQLAPGALQSL